MNSVHHLNLFVFFRCSSLIRSTSTVNSHLIQLQHCNLTLVPLIEALELQSSVIRARLLWLWIHRFLHEFVPLGIVVSNFKASKKKYERNCYLLNGATLVVLLQGHNQIGKRFYDES
ncbi:unnamed protein product [Vicia faba]|uniref:Uncharacterized protein n=1 Tax=Vicia faba TaxID=3906 RepID=A0AAV1AMG0_VICFA|nr:unnamed protein product [Vicia faba]